MAVRATRAAETANVCRSFLGGASSATLPAGANAASQWFNHAISVYEGTIEADSAPPGGNSWTIRCFDDAADDGSAVVLTSAGDSIRGSMGANFTAAANSGYAASDVLKLFDTGAGNPIIRVATFYRDDTDDEVSIQGFGDGATNHAIGATDEFIGPEGITTNITETQTRAIIPTTGTLKNFHGRFGTGGDNTYELAVMINGTPTTIGSFGPAGSALVSFGASPIAVAAGDEISFRIHRTAGASTTCVFHFQFSFRPDSL